MQILNKMTEIPELKSPVAQEWLIILQLLYPGDAAFQFNHDTLMVIS